MIHPVADPEGGFRGLEPPFFWQINAFEWEHIVGTPPLLWVGNPPFLKWLDPRLTSTTYSPDIYFCISISELDPKNKERGIMES